MLVSSAYKNENNLKLTYICIYIKRGWKVHMMMSYLLLSIATLTEEVCEPQGVGLVKKKQLT